MREDKQAGFSIVQVILALAAVSIIGVAGVFVYQHNRLQLSSAAPVSNKQVTLPNATTPPATTTLIKIADLGIQITVPNNIKNLTYQTSTVTLANGNTATYALLSTTALAAADAKCGTSSAALGSLEAASGQYPSSDPYAALDYGPLLKQFPAFYVTYAAPQGGCSNGSSVLSALATTKSSFQEALSTVQAIN